MDLVDLDLTLGEDDDDTVSIIEVINFEAVELFAILRPLHKEDHHGGYLCVADTKTGMPYIILGLGQVPAEKIEKYFNFCQEKARRLAAHPKHVCSAQSRDDQAEKWPGAIRTNDLIISFSGLPWEIDEAFCLLLAIRLELIDTNQASKITRLSGNTKLKGHLALKKTLDLNSLD